MGRAEQKLEGIHNRKEPMSDSEGKVLCKGYSELQRERFPLGLLLLLKGFTLHVSFCFKMNVPLSVSCHMIKSIAGSVECVSKLTHFFHPD